MQENITHPLHGTHVPEASLQKKKRKKRKLGPPLEPATLSKELLVRLAPSQVGMFRFLLEAYEHIAYFSVINRHEALLKIVFSPHREKAAHKALEEIGHSLPLEILPWPYSVASKVVQSEAL